jgi:L-ascorbate metabolism protein UlaG (beta-lactamase superfamily)
MKVTKYPQSCLVLEKEGKCLIIDPGSLVSSKYSASDLPRPDAILLTHEHQDHADPELIKSLAGEEVPVVGNQSTADTLNNIVTQVVRDGEAFEVAGFQMTARELPHCLMQDGSEGPQNTGYVVDSVFFHPGDGDSIENLRVATLALPIAGPDISPRDVFDFIKQVQCEKVVPIHYDYFPGDPNFYANLAKSSDLAVEFIVLDNGESAEV